MVTRDLGRILKLLQCEPDTPAIPVARAHNRLVSGAFDRFAQEVGARWSEQKHTVRLTVTHDELEAGGKMAADIGRGWPIVQHSLKSFLETGRPLDIFARPKAA